MSNTTEADLQARVAHLENILEVITSNGVHDNSHGIGCRHDWGKLKAGDWICHKCFKTSQEEQKPDRNLPPGDCNMM